MMAFYNFIVSLKMLKLTLIYWSSVYNKNNSWQSTANMSV